MLNLFEIGEYFAHIEYEHDNQEPLPLRYIYCPPWYMTNLNLNEDDPSSNILSNSSMQLEGELKVGIKYRTNVDCMRAIKMFHMENFVDYTVDRTNMGRYVVLLS